METIISCNKINIALQELSFYESWSEVFLWNLPNHVKLSCGVVRIRENKYNITVFYWSFFYRQVLNLILFQVTLIVRAKSVVAILPFKDQVFSMVSVDLVLFRRWTTTLVVVRKLAILPFKDQVVSTSSIIRTLDYNTNCCTNTSSIDFYGLWRCQTWNTALNYSTSSEG